MKSIKKGQKFLCLKDYRMEEGSLAYQCGQVYEATGKNTLPSLFDNTHVMFRTTDFDEHFEKQKKNKSGAYIKDISVIFETVKSDSIVESVIKKFKYRSDVGIKKYGTTLDRNDLKISDWINHAQEEAMDFCLYLERLKKEFNN